MSFRLSKGAGFIDWRDRGSDIFESVGAFGANGEALSGAGEAELLLGVQASREVPGLLGLHPILGRGFVAADELPGGPHVVIIGEHLWRSHFGADPGIVGRAITLTDVSYQVIGVFPSTASAIPPSPSYMARGKPADFWQPLSVSSAPRRRRWPSATCSRRSSSESVDAIRGFTARSRC